LVLEGYLGANVVGAQNHAFLSCRAAIGQNNNFAVFQSAQFDKNRGARAPVTRVKEKQRWMLQFSHFLL
jgi:hypothetical protein